MNSLPPFISEKDITKRVRELGEAITKDLGSSVSEQHPLVCVGILKGSFIFFADLVRQIHLPVSIDFLGASSYGQNTNSSGMVKITLDLSAPIQGRHVLLVEDIIDTGLTMNYLLDTLRLRQPASLRLCSLLLKPSQLKKNVSIDYLGFTADNRFIVGYGLDAGDRYRNLPHLCLLPENKETS